MEKQTVLSLSGGLDSTTLLAYLIEHGHKIHCVSFIYGSKHNPYEITAAGNVVQFYKNKGVPISWQTIEVSQLFTTSPSSLMDDTQSIPEGHYNAESMKSTVVPGRNLIFASILASIAENKKYNTIALGVHAGDHYIYPDCRPEFLQALTAVVKASSDDSVGILTPFENFSKKDILNFGMSCEILPPYQLTRTCYKNQPLSCGKCGSCQERLEAFSMLQIKDPITYE